MSQHDHPTETLESSGDGSSPKKAKPAATLPADLTAGRKLGPYTIIEEVGRGGMGVVFRAYDPALQRDVALKLIPPQFARDEQKLGRFLREARSAAQLSHPGIVPIHFAGQEDGIAFIAMGFVDGRPLGDVIEDGLIAPVQAVAIVRDVALALHHAHKAGIVHRDIKPDNIMLSVDGEVKITDFGLARSDSKPGAAGRITDTGMYIGTPVYSSPEQVKAGEVDGRADIYSLGVVFYEMVTGQTPFRADSPYKLFHAILNDTPPSPDAINPLVPEAVAGVIEKMMQRDAALRYASADEVVADCEKLLRVLDGSARLELPPGESARSAAIPPTVQLPRSSKTGMSRRTSLIATITGEPARKRVGLIVGAAALLLIGVLIGIYVAVNQSAGNGPGNRSASNTPAPANAGGEVTPGVNRPMPAPQPIERPKTRVLIRRFNNINGLDAMQSISLIVPSLMATSLSMADQEGTAFLHVIDQDAQSHMAAQLGLTDPANDPVQFDRLARALHAEVIVRGQFLVFENVLVIDASMDDTVSGDRLGTVRVTGSENQIFVLVDQLAEQIRHSLAERYAPESLSAINGWGSLGEPVVEKRRKEGWEALLEAGGTKQTVAEQVRQTCEKLREELPGCAGAMRPEEAGREPRGTGRVGSSSSAATTVIDPAPAPADAEADETPQLRAERSLRRALRQLQGNGETGEAAPGWLRQANLNLQDALQRYNSTVLDRKEQLDVVEFLRKMAGPAGENLALPDGVAVAPDYGNSASTNRQPGTANGQSQQVEQRVEQRVEQGQQVEQLEQLNDPDHDPAASKRYDSWRTPRAHNSRWDSLDEDQRERLLQAAHFHMLAHMHIERARNARAQGDEQLVAGELQFALGHLIQALLIEPRFSPAMQDLKRIRDESWAAPQPQQQQRAK
ncbi:MAG: serine/threonine-protein kinase [Planctomycetota bacterium]